MRTVYLAGPIRGHTYEQANGWRNEVARRLEVGISGINPLRGKECLSGRGVLGEHESYADLLNCSPAEVTARDRFDCMHADLVLFNFTGPPANHIGSLIEVGWADAARIPIVMVGFEAHFKGHPMMEALVAWKCKNLDQAIEVCNAFLSPYTEI